MCSTEDGAQYSGGCSVRRSHTIIKDPGVPYRSVKPSVQRRHVLSKEAGIQCESVTPSVRRRHTFSAEGVQCRSGTPSVQARVIRRISQIISMDEYVQYRTTRTAEGENDLLHTIPV